MGAGTGAATLELARRGAGRITALEPDPRLAELLVSKASSSDAPVEVRIVTLEEADLPDASFDLVVSATAFHWVDETLGLEIVRRVLRPGAVIALWWTVFGDPMRDDPFHAATKRRLDIGFSSPSAGVRPSVPHALDVPARRAALEGAGFEDVQHELMRRLVRFTAREIRELYSTFAQNQQLPAAERDALLDDLEGIAQREFGGVVERPIQTSLYIARRSS